MSGTPSAITDPRAEGLLARPQERLEQLLRQQRVLAWVLSLLILTITVVFFAMMTLAAPLLSRVAFGRSVTVANVAAVAIIVWFLISIAVFSWQANRVDALRSRITQSER